MGKISSLFRKKENCIMVNEADEEIIFRFTEPGIKDVMKLDKKYSKLDRETEEVRLQYLREQTLLYFKAFIEEKGGKEQPLTEEVYEDLSPSIIMRLWMFITMKQNTSSFREK